MNDHEKTAWELDHGEGRVRAGASLTILSRELPPEEIARRLRLEPDRMWRRGDPRGPRGRQTQAFNGLDYHSELDEKRTPTDHLAALVERLRPYTAQIAAVAADPATHCTRIWVAEHSERDNVEVWTDPEIARAVADMGAELIFDVYFYSDDDD